MIGVNAYPEELGDLVDVIEPLINEMKLCFAEGNYLEASNSKVEIMEAMAKWLANLDGSPW